MPSAVTYPWCLQSQTQNEGFAHLGSPHVEDLETVERRAEQKWEDEGEIPQIEGGWEMVSVYPFQS